eukprot:2662027-Rhodomonas_salina.1
MAINLLRTLVQAELGGWEGGYSHWEEREARLSGLHPILLAYDAMPKCTGRGLGYLSPRTTWGLLSCVGTEPWDNEGDMARRRFSRATSMS